MLVVYMAWVAGTHQQLIGGQVITTVAQANLRGSETCWVHSVRNGCRWLLVPGV